MINRNVTKNVTVIKNSDDTFKEYNDIFGKLKYIWYKTYVISYYKTPSNESELQKFLGIITCIGKFITNLSNKLLRKNVEFVWTSNEQKAFEDLKIYVTNLPVLAYFDVNKHSIVLVDASQYWLGGVFVQDEQWASNSHPMHEVAHMAISLAQGNLKIIT